eukprot:1280784-Amphidinium_carterae.1
MLVKFLSNGIWTEQDKLRHGLQHTGECKWCGQMDTFRHHLLDCPRHARRNGVSLSGGTGEVLNALCATGVGGSRFWPLADWFRVSDTPEWRYRVEDRTVCRDVGGLLWFTDGSAMYPGNRVLRRSAWGAVAL